MSDFLTRDAIKAIADHRGDAIVVSTMTSIRWVGTFLDDPLNISCVPLMGGSSALGLGLALARPERKVIVLDGDGSLLMQLGSLVSVANAGPDNLIHMVFNNGVWFENMANLPLPGAGQTDYAGMARAAGFKDVFSFDRLADWRIGLADVFADSGPVFVELKVVPEADAVWTADAPQPDLPELQFTRMGDEGRRIMAALSSS